MSNLIKVAVPAGIGDVSWIWSKLSTIQDKGFQIFTPDTTPQRTFYWLHLLGSRVIPAIGKHGYNDILTQESRKGYEEYTSWKEILKNYEEDEVIYLQPNQWFLKGRSLESWLPDLKTDYHYPIYESPQDDEIGKKLIEGYRYPVAMHMGCVRGAKAWNTWLAEDWAAFIVALKKEFPEIQPILMGGIWDLDMAMEVMGRLPEDIKVVDLIGRTTIGQAITILRNVTYFVGFSSGLNVMCNVLNKPCTAMWPKHQRDHIYPHADPKMIDERTYLGFCYDDPSRIVIRLSSSLRKEMTRKWES